MDSAGGTATDRRGIDGAPRFTELERPLITKLCCYVSRVTIATNRCSQSTKHTQCWQRGAMTSSSRRPRTMSSSWTPSNLVLPAFSIQLRR